MFRYTCTTLLKKTRQEDWIRNPHDDNNNNNNNNNNTNNKACIYISPLIKLDCRYRTVQVDILL